MNLKHKLRSDIFDRLYYIYLYYTYSLKNYDIKSNSYNLSLQFQLLSKFLLT